MAADKVATECGVELVAAVGEREAAGMRSDAEGTRALQWRKGSDGNVRECGIECGVAKGFGDDGVRIGVLALKK